MYEKISDIVLDFAQRAAKVNNDNDLSREGKIKKLAAIQAEKMAALKPMVTELRKKAVDAALACKDAAVVAQSHQQIADDSWDFSRLTYESQAVKSAMAIANDDFYQIETLWGNIQKSNDSHKVKAFVDTAPANIPQNSKHPEQWQKLAQTFKMPQVQSEVNTAYAAKVDELKSLRFATDLLAKQFQTSELAPNKAVAQRIFSGIGFKGSEVVLGKEFERQQDKYVKELFESNDSVFKRLEGLREAEEATQAAVFEQFGTEYNPLVDGVLV